MARKNESILDILMVLPWWVSVIISALTYWTLAILLPSMEFENVFLKGIAMGLSHIAIILALVLLIPAPISVFNSWRKSKQLDKQKSIYTIRDLSWKQFEELVAEAYRRQGYTVIENHRGGADGGVDIRLQKDGATHLIQCKNWRSSKIGVKVIRELFGVMIAEGAISASVVCSGMFTQDAKNFAHDKAVDLVDGPKLESMIRQVQAVRPSATITPRASASINSSCPWCGNNLVRRKAQKGKNAGNEFYGCSTFPKCRYIKNIGS